MNKELMTVEQLPIIKRQLQKVKEEVLKRTKDAKNLVCTEDNIREVKKLRAQLRKELDEFERGRKEIKKAVMQPYEEFESEFKDCITVQYRAADISLAAKISEIENERKAQITVEVKKYFDEYRASLELPDGYGIWEDYGFKPTLSGSMTANKKAIKEWLDKISQDIKMISKMEDSAEILAEYKYDNDASRAIVTVTERHERERLAKERLEEEKKKAEERLKKEEELNALQPQEEKFTEAPTAEETPEKKEEHVMVLRLKVLGTKSQLQELINFMKEKGIKYGKLNS